MRIANWLVAMVGLLVLTGLGQAGEVQGFVVEVSVPFSAVGGDLNGTDFLVDSEELALLPDFGSGAGLGFGAGWKGGSTMILLRYFRSSHKTSFDFELPEGLASARGDGSYSVAGLKLQRQFLRDKPLQIHIMMGVDVPWVVARDAGVTSSGETGDVRFIGAGLEFGLGATVQPTPHLHISGGPVFRGMLLGWVRGASGTTKSVTDMMVNQWQAALSGGLWCGGLGFEVSAGYTF